MNSLIQSRRWCAAVMRERAKSFSLATRFLPKEKRHGIEALYGFCRFADDLADVPGSSKRARLKTFDRIERALTVIDGTDDEDFPWFAAFRDACRRFPIAMEDARRLVRGCRSDLEAVHVESLESLNVYAGAVAGTVGRCALAVLGASDADSLSRGERLGIAMQLTNVIRDVAEDARMGRLYLPLQEFGGDAKYTMKMLASIAREHYRVADDLARRLPNDGSRVALLLARSTYEGILDRIEWRGYQPDAGRVFVPFHHKLGLAARSVVDAYAGRPGMR